MLKFTKRDVLFTLILGEIVGLFAYAIIRQQARAEGASEMLRGLAELPITLPALAILVPIAALAALVLTYLLGKRVNPALFQFGKFAAVGFSNTAIDWGILNLLLAPFGLSGIGAIMGKAISFIVATLNSFLWNRFWSFEQKGTEHMGKQAVQFYLVTGVGFLVNVTVYAAVNSIGSDTALWAGIVAPAAATASAMFWNFFGYKLVVFKATNDQRPTTNN